MMSAPEVDYDDPYWDDLDDDDSWLYEDDEFYDDELDAEFEDDEWDDDWDDDSWLYDEDEDDDL